MTKSLRAECEENKGRKYLVNDGCIGCGLCNGICPAVFSMSDGGVAVAIETEAPEEALESAVEAKDGCPVAGIEEIDRGEMSCYTTLKSALV